MKRWNILEDLSVSVINDDCWFSFLNQKDSGSNNITRLYNVTWFGNVVNTTCRSKILVVIYDQPQGCRTGRAYNCGYFLNKRERTREQEKEREREREREKREQEREQENEWERERQTDRQTERRGGGGGKWIVHGSQVNFINDKYKDSLRELFLFFQRKCFSTLFFIE